MMVVFGKALAAPVGNPTSRRGSATPAEPPIHAPVKAHPMPQKAALAEGDSFHRQGQAVQFGTRKKPTFRDNAGMLVASGLTRGAGAVTSYQYGNRDLGERGIVSAERGYQKGKAVLFALLEGRDVVDALKHRKRGVLERYDRRTHPKDYR